MKTRAGVKGGRRKRAHPSFANAHATDPASSPV